MTRSTRTILPALFLVITTLMHTEGQNRVFKLKNDPSGHADRQAVAKSSL